jgi:hypothetical protein
MTTHTFDQHVRKEMIANVVINVVINCAIIWMLNRHKDTVSAFGDKGFRVDIFATAFLLFFLMSLIVMSIHRAQQRANKLPEFQINPQNWRHKLFSRLPYSVWALALGFGLFALVVFAPLTVGFLAVFSITELPPLTYTIGKGFWVAFFVALMNRTIIEAALIKPVPHKT